eukprot:127020-Prymnesium_polylepis.1
MEDRLMRFSLSETVFGRCLPWDFGLPPLPNALADILSPYYGASPLLPRRAWGDSPIRCWGCVLCSVDEGTRNRVAQRLDLSLDATHASFPLHFASPHSNHGGRA